MDQLTLFDAPMKCSVESCTRLIRVKRDRLCGPHYKRKWRHGDPLAGGAGRPNARAGKAPVDLEDGTRRCRDCGEAKPLDHFPQDRSGTKGRRASCKPCHTAQAKAWYADNMERQRRRQVERYHRDIDKSRAMDKLRYERHKPKRIALVTEAVHRRRALMKQVEYEPGITVKALRKRHGDDCCYCGVTMQFTPGDGHTFVPLKATIEHIVAITRGGGHTWANTALCCWQCNVRKNAKPLDQWLDSIAIDDDDAA